MVHMVYVALIDVLMLATIVHCRL